MEQQLEDWQNDSQLSDLPQHNIKCFTHSIKQNQDNIIVKQKKDNPFIKLKKIFQLKIGLQNQINNQNSQISNDLINQSKLLLNQQLSINQQNIYNNSPLIHQNQINTSYLQVNTHNQLSNIYNYKQYHNSQQLININQQILTIDKNQKQIQCIKNVEVKNYKKFINDNKNKQTKVKNHKQSNINPISQHVSNNTNNVNSSYQKRQVLKCTPTMIFKQIQRQKPNTINDKKKQNLLQMKKQIKNKKCPKINIKITQTQLPQSFNKIKQNCLMIKNNRIKKIKQNQDIKLKSILSDNNQIISLLSDNQQQQNYKQSIISIQNPQICSIYKDKSKTSFSQIIKKQSINFHNLKFQTVSPTLFKQGELLELEDNYNKKLNPQKQLSDGINANKCQKNINLQFLENSFFKVNSSLIRNLMKNYQKHQKYKQNSSPHQIQQNNPSTYSQQNSSYIQPSIHQQISNSLQNKQLFQKIQNQWNLTNKRIKIKNYIVAYMQIRQIAQQYIQGVINQSNMNQLHEIQLQIKQTLLKEIDKINKKYEEHLKNPFNQQQFLTKLLNIPIIDRKLVDQQQKYTYIQSIIFQQQQLKLSQKINQNKISGKRHRNIICIKDDKIVQSDSFQQNKQSKNINMENQRMLGEEANKLDSQPLNVNQYQLLPLFGCNLSDNHFRVNPQKCNEPIAAMRTQKTDRARVEQSQQLTEQSKKRVKQIKKKKEKIPKKHKNQKSQQKIKLQQNKSKTSINKNQLKSQQKSNKNILSISQNQIINHLNTSISIQQPQFKLPPIPNQKSKFSYQTTPSLYKNINCVNFNQQNQQQNNHFEQQLHISLLQDYSDYTYLSDQLRISNHENDSPIDNNDNEINEFPMMIDPIKKTDKDNNEQQLQQNNQKQNQCLMLDYIMQLKALMNQAIPNFLMKM